VLRFVVRCRRMPDVGVVLTPDFHVACGSHIKLPRGNDFDAEMARSLLTRLHNLHVALNRVSRVCASISTDAMCIWRTPWSWCILCLNLIDRLLDWHLSALNICRGGGLHGCRQAAAPTDRHHSMVSSSCTVLHAAPP